MRTIRTICALVLAAGLVLGLFAGCGGEKAAAMGRYVEETVALPENLQSVLSAGVNGDGDLVCCGVTREGEALRFILPLDGGETGSEPIAWLGDLLQGGGTVSGFSENGGTAYAIVSDSEGKPALYVSRDGVTCEALPTPDWAQGGMRLNPGGGGNGGGPQTQTNPGGQGGQPNPGGGTFSLGGGLRPGGVTALEDGCLITYSMDGGVRQYDASGREVRKYMDAASAGMGIMNAQGGGAAVYGNTLALASAQKGEILLYDLTDGGKTGTVPFENLDAFTYVGLDADGLLVADNSGVYRREKNAWRLAVDGGLTSLVSPSLSVQLALQGGGTDYYVLVNGGISGMGNIMGGDTRLLRFRYDENLPSQPSQTLEIFSLYDNTTVRLAVGEFQRANPDVRVNLQVGIEADGSATVDDVVRALNTQLIAGKGPDLLVLDGLPLRSYIEKGVLEDISALADKLAAAGDLFMNLMSAYTLDGKVYGLPTRFALPVMVGGKDALADFGSLSSLIEAVKADSAPEPFLLRRPDNLYGSRNAPMFAPDPKGIDGGAAANGGVLMNYYEACAHSFTSADGSLDEEALTAYFAGMLALTDALKTLYPETDMDSRGGMQAFVSMGRGRGEALDMGSQDIAQGRALAHIQQLSGVGSLSMLARNLSGLENMELRSLFGQNQYYPRDGIGIVAGGGQRDLAEAFLETLLSAEVQGSLLSGAFPVNRASLRTTLNDIQEITRTVMGETIGDMGFVELCETLAVPVLIDQRVKEAVAAQCQALLEGTVTPEEAAAKVVAEMRLYLAE